MEDARYVLNDEVLEGVMRGEVVADDVDDVGEGMCEVVLPSATLHATMFGIGGRKRSWRRVRDFEFV